MSYHWHAETSACHVDKHCLVDSLHFLVSFYLPLVSSFIHGVGALKGKDLRDLFVLLLNNALYKWIPQFAARDFTAIHGAVINSAVTLQINDCSYAVRCEWE